MKFDNNKSLERTLALRGVRSLSEAVSKARGEKTQKQDCLPSESMRQVVTNKLEVPIGRTLDSKSGRDSSNLSTSANPWNNEFALSIKFDSSGMHFFREEI